MPQGPRPFFKANRNTWYCDVNRVQHTLGKHPDGLPPPVRQNGIWLAPPAIMTAFYKVMARADEVEPPPAKAPTGHLALAVFEEFLSWCEKHKAPLTYVWYRDRITAFARTIERHLPVAELKPIDVERWVDANPDWSPSHQRGCKVAVQRAFRWAEKMGVIASNPIRHLEKPQAGKREQLISPAEYGNMLSRYEDDAFRDLLEMAWHSGARPQETVRVEARHVDLDNRRIVLPPKEAKGKKRYRIIYLNDHALELVKARMEAHPDSTIFRNTRGNPWKAAAVNNRFCRLQHALGREHLGGVTLDDEEVKAFAATLPPQKTVKGKVVAKSEKDLLREARKKLSAKAASAAGTKFALYAFRHSFSNRLLTAGVDALTVSTLLGHVDGTMLAKVYSHLQKNADHLLDVLNRTSTVAGV